MNAVRIVQRQAELSGSMSREECIHLLAREAAELWYPGLAEALAHAAIERESTESTYLGRGLAVPHARVPELPHAAVYLAQSEGLSWPEEAAQCVALLCVPAEQPELHLQLLSKIVRWRMKGGSLVL